jgi:hypothetical protein
MPAASNHGRRQTSCSVGSRLRQCVASQGWPHPTTSIIKIVFANPFTAGISLSNGSLGAYKSAKCGQAGVALRAIVRLNLANLPECIMVSADLDCLGGHPH